MQIELPIFRQILRNTSLSERELQVFRAAIEYLDVVEYRELKLLVIEQHLALDKSAVSRALRSLVHEGYLCRAGGRAGATAQYRVPLSRKHCVRDDTPPRSDAEGSTMATAPTRGRTRPRQVSRGVL